MILTMEGGVATGLCLAVSRLGPLGAQGGATGRIHQMILTMEGGDAIGLCLGVYRAAPVGAQGGPTHAVSLPGLGGFPVSEVRV